MRRGARGRNVDDRASEEVSLMKDRKVVIIRATPVIIIVGVEGLSVAFLNDRAAQSSGFSRMTIAALSTSVSIGISPVLLYCFRTSRPLALMLASLATSNFMTSISAWTPRFRSS